MTTKNGRYLCTTIQKLGAGLIPVFHWCATNRGRKKKSKISKVPKFFTISLAAPKPKANMCFGRVLLQGWEELGLFWFTLATGLTKGLWHCPLRDVFGRQKCWRTPLTMPYCAAKLPRAGNWGWRLHPPTESKEILHKAFYNSCLSLTEGNRQPFFLR